MENKDNVQKLKQPEPADIAKEQKEIAIKEIEANDFNVVVSFVPAAPNSRVKLQIKDMLITTNGKPEETNIYQLLTAVETFVTNQLDYMVKSERSAIGAEMQPKR